MRTNISTLIALNTIFGDPFRNMNGNPAFFKLCCSTGECTIFAADKSTDGNIISFKAVYFIKDLFYKVGFVRIVFDWFNK